jgi:hypothetical protein
MILIMKHGEKDYNQNDSQISQIISNVSNKFEIMENWRILAYNISTFKHHRLRPITRLSILIDHSKNISHEVTKEYPIFTLHSTSTSCQDVLTTKIEIGPEPRPDCTN